MTDDEFWEIERGFWLQGRAHYERWFSSDCVAGFPMPTGIMAGNGFVSSLPDDGSWKEVEMGDRTLSRPRTGVVVLGYVGAGQRGEETYRCVCTSTYLEGGSGWRMIQHQQTPAGEA